MSPEAGLSRSLMHQNGRPYAREDSGAACRRAGQPGRLIHDLRRTAARRFVRSGLQPAVAQRLTGHATPSVFQRYNIISEADLRDAAKVLDKAAGR